MNRCPVCWGRATRTTQGNIGAHWDGAGALCPASTYPFYITVAGRRRYVLREAS